MRQKACCNFWKSSVETVKAHLEETIKDVPSVISGPFKNFLKEIGNACPVCREALVDGLPEPSLVKPQNENRQQGEHPPIKKVIMVCRGCKGTKKNKDGGVCMDCLGTGDPRNGIQDQHLD